MKRHFLVLAVVLFLMNISFANSFTSENKEVNNIVISELANPVEFDLIIDTNNVTEDITLSSYLGISFFPNEFENISGRNEIRITAYIPESITRVSGNYDLGYNLRGVKSSTVKDTFRIRVMNIDKAIAISPMTVELGQSSANVLVENKINQTIKDFKINAVSAFFDEEFIIDIEPYGQETLRIDLDSDKAKGILFGTYFVQFYINNSRTYIESNLNYVEKEDSLLVKNASGFIVRKVVYTKTNTGNVPILGEIDFSKDVFSRLFTITSTTPESKERGALSVKYYWNKELLPGESFSVSSTTNYTFPFILLLIIFLVAFIVKMYMMKNLSIEKKVSYVKTKGGEFALKVTLHLKARKYIENVQIIDRLPAMTQLYEKFGIKPTKIDHASRRIFWDLDRLNAGEERVYSYIIFSKVAVVGRFELPAASLTYDREGKTEQVVSNRAFFVAETFSKNS